MEATYVNLSGQDEVGCVRKPERSLISAGQSVKEERGQDEAPGPESMVRLLVLCMCVCTRVRVSTCACS